MGLLPDLDSNGFIVEKRVPKTMPTSSRNKRRTLDWTLLKSFQCPSCGESMKEKSGKYICADTQCGMQIRSFKVNQIRHGLKLRDDMKLPAFE